MEDFVNALKQETLILALNHYNNTRIALALCENIRRFSQPISRRNSQVRQRGVFCSRLSRGNAKDHWVRHRAPGIG